MYATSFFVLAIVFNLMWRYAVRVGIVRQHVNVGAITKQYRLGPIMYGVLVIVAYFSAEWCLILSAVYALYFALPPKLWGKRATASP